MNEYKNTLRELYFTKSEVVKDLYLAKSDNIDRKEQYYLFSNKAQYEGNYENKVIDRFLDDYGLKVEHEEINGQPVKEPRMDIRHLAVKVPPKQYFPDEVSYYQVVLHEASHYMSHIARQDTAQDFQTAAKLYTVESFANGKAKEGLNDLVTMLHNREAFDNASPIEKGLVLAYQKEELKVETANVSALKALGYKLLERNEKSYDNIVNTATTFSKWAGQDFHKELTQDRNSHQPDAKGYAQEGKNLYDMIKHNLENAAQSLGMESITQGKSQEVSKENEQGKSK